MLQSRFRIVRVLLAASLAFALPGCAHSPLASRTAAFSSAANAAVLQTGNAYQLVNQAHLDAQTATLVANYDGTPFDANAIQPFLPSEDLAVRTSILAALSQYATLLAEVSGNQPMKDLETRVEAAGNSVVTLSTDSFKSFKTLDDTQKNIAVTAIVTLGSVLIEHRRERTLPGILKKMDKPIQDICRILESDIGTPEHPALASTVDGSYGTQIYEQQRFLQRGSAGMSAEERRSQIALLPKLATAQRQSASALAATVKSLAALASAHSALLATKGQKDSPAFRLKLAELSQSVQAINSFYLSLPAK